MTGMRTIKNKLSSQRGASLTFALLMFLVCAVVGSAVLTAGTAAAGRMSRIAETDQRYYSVNSAARLLIELLEKDKIWFEEEEPEEDESGEEAGDEPAADEEDLEKNYKLYIGAEEVGDTESSLAIDIARRTLEMEEDTPKLSVPLSLTADEDSLAVSIEETIYPGGDLELAVSNEDDSTRRYTITLYFMNAGGASSFKWKLYDIDSKMPLGSPSGTGG